MQLANTLRAAGVPCFPCNAAKAPAIPKDTDWRDWAMAPVEGQRWPAPIVGVPIPDGVVVIDLDTYKGATREAVERLLGCPLDWDAALLQTTMHGGQHYAFAVDWPVRQGSDLQNIRGLDTRVAGKGYIATGSGYTPHGFGVYALAQRGSLPRLPDACRAVLEHVKHEKPDRPPITDTADTETIRAALRHIPPGRTRKDWVITGLSLRALTYEEPEVGLSLFDEWSSGALWPDGTPDNYNPDHIETQWWSFKPEGDVTGGTLFYEAMQGGWVPPATFDTSLAFGADAMAADQFGAVIERITESGGDPKQTNELLAEIGALQCNQLQQSVLVALLRRELKEAGLLTKAIREQLDGMVGRTAPPKPAGAYGKNHTENAVQFLEKYFPDGTLVRSDQVWFDYIGAGWREVEDDDLAHKLAVDMAPSFPQTADVNGTYNMLAMLTHRQDQRITDRLENLILFQNGVLELTTGVLMPHDPKYFTTNVLPYGYNSDARCDRWLAFLSEIFEGDAERIALLQEWFGYMLSNSYAFHKVLLMLGPARSGKGTIGRILERIVGPQNYSGGSLHAFTSDSFIESLRTKPVMFIGDSEKGVSRNTADHVIERIKKISGNDAVTFDRKYKTTLSETLPTRITIAANGVPRLFDDSGALASRLLVLPFNLTFYGRENPHLTAELLTEIEGIALWSLHGMARLNVQAQFTEPAASADEAQFIAESYSPLKQFIGECCILGGEARTTAVDLYNAYHAWAVQNNEANVLSRRPFISAFKDATRGQGCRYGTPRIEGDTARGFIGLAIAANAPTTATAFGPKAVG